MNGFEEDESIVTTPHLDDETFMEMTLGGAPDHKAHAHLASCAQCRAELKRFEEAVGGFSKASLAWSEEKSRELPALRPKAAAERKTPRVVVGLGWAMAALLVAVGVPVTMHESTLRHEAAVQVAADDDPSGLNSPQQIAKDNELLAEVNYELVHSHELNQELSQQFNRQMRVSPIAGAGKTMPERRNP